MRPLASLPLNVLFLGHLKSRKEDTRGFMCYALDPGAGPPVLSVCSASLFGGKKLMNGPGASATAGQTSWERIVCSAKQIMNLVCLLFCLNLNLVCVLARRRGDGV